MGHGTPRHDTEVMVYCCPSLMNERERLHDQGGIAKGVRRIVAVTRGMAHAANGRARAFEQQLAAADAINDISLDALVN